jgi:predicted phosphoadenosine phosphosulfate sulfurtransferase
MLIFPSPFYKHKLRYSLAFWQKVEMGWFCDVYFLHAHIPLFFIALALFTRDGKKSLQLSQIAERKCTSRYRTICDVMLKNFMNGNDDAIDMLGMC